MSQRAVKDFANTLETAVDPAALEGELRAMVELTRDFVVVPMRAPDNFRAALRDQLVRAAADGGTALAPWGRVREGLTSWRVRRTARVVSACAVVIVVLSSIAAATPNTMPGDPLYAAKRATESVRLALARSDEARAAEHRSRAERRLSEIRVLAAGGDYERLVALLDDMDDATVAAAGLASTAGGLAELRAFAAAQQAALAAIVSSLPTPAAGRARKSLALFATFSGGGLGLNADLGTGASTPAVPGDQGISPAGPSSELAPRPSPQPSTNPSAAESSSQPPAAEAGAPGINSVAPAAVPSPAAATPPGASVVLPAPRREVPSVPGSATTRGSRGSAPSPSRAAGRLPSVRPLPPAAPRPTSAARPTPAPRPATRPRPTPAPLPLPLPLPLPTVEPRPPSTPLPTVGPLPSVVPTSLPSVIPSSLSTGPPLPLPTAPPDPLPTAVPTALPTAVPTALPTALATVPPLPIPPAPLPAPSQSLPEPTPGISSLPVPVPPLRRLL